MSLVSMPCGVSWPEGDLFVPFLGDILLKSSEEDNYRQAHLYIEAF